jgi:hypothetical protein
MGMGDLYPLLRVGGEDYFSLLTCGRNHAILDMQSHRLLLTEDLVLG